MKEENVSATNFGHKFIMCVSACKMTATWCALTMSSNLFFLRNASICSGPKECPTPLDSLCTYPLTLWALGSDHMRSHNNPCSPISVGLFTYIYSMVWDECIEFLVKMSICQHRFWSFYTWRYTPFFFWFTVLLMSVTVFKYGLRPPWQQNTLLEMTAATGNTSNASAKHLYTLGEDRRTHSS